MTGTTVCKTCQSGDIMASYEQNNVRSCYNGMNEMLRIVKKCCYVT